MQNLSSLSVLTAIAIILSLNSPVASESDQQVANQQLAPESPSLASGEPSEQAPPAARPNRQAHFVQLDATEKLQQVAVGRSAKFRCVVEDIGAHKLAWFHKDKRLLLALDNKTVAWRERVQVSSQANSVFFLQLDNVQLADKGQITCQLNTQPVQSQVHILDVVKSPKIREEETTVSLEPVKEFGSVELRCAADGVPMPTIKWRRESQFHILPPTEEDEEPSADLAGELERSSANQMSPESAESSRSAARLRRRRVDEAARLELFGGGDGFVGSPNGSQGRSDPLSSPITSTTTTREGAANKPLAGGQTRANSTGVGFGAKLFIGEGQVLRLDRVSRHDMGFYMCIASNGVPPSVSQRIFLPVSFARTSSSQVSNSQAEEAERPGGNLWRQQTAAAAAATSAQDSSAPLGRSANSSQVRTSPGKVTDGLKQRNTIHSKKGLKAARSSASGSASSSSSSSGGRSQVCLARSLTLATVSGLASSLAFERVGLASCQLLLGRLLIVIVALAASSAD